MGPIKNSKMYKRSGKIYERPVPQEQSIFPEVSVRHPMRQFTKRRERIVAKFMAAFRANTENYARYGSQEWILSLIQHVDEKPHQNLIPEDVERWLRTEKFFKQDNLNFNYGSQRTNVGNTDQPEAPVASSHSSGSGSGAVVTPELIDIQDDADADRVMVEDAPKDQMINPDANGDGDIAGGGGLMQDAPVDLKGELDKHAADDLGIQEAPLDLTIKQEPKEEDVGDVPEGEDVKEDAAGGDDSNLGKPATVSPDAAAVGDGEQQYPILMKPEAQRCPQCRHPLFVLPKLIEGLKHVTAIANYMQDETRKGNASTGFP